MATHKHSRPISKFLNNVTQNTTSDSIFVGDTKSVEFSVLTDSNADFEIRAIGSVQEDPPLPNSPQNEDNDFQYVLFQDETASATYNGSNPFNPGNSSVSKIFRFNTENIRWAFIEISNYSSGTLIVTNVNLSDNL